MNVLCIYTCKHGYVTIVLMCNVYVCMKRQNCLALYTKSPLVVKHSLDLRCYMAVYGQHSILPPQAGSHDTLVTFLCCAIFGIKWLPC